MKWMFNYMYNTCSGTSPSGDDSLPGNLYTVYEMSIIKKNIVTVYLIKQWYTPWYTQWYTPWYTHANQCKLTLQIGIEYKNVNFPCVVCELIRKVCETFVGHLIIRCQ